MKSALLYKKSILLEDFFKKKLNNKFAKKSPEAKMKSLRILLAGFVAFTNADTMSHTGHRSIKELHSHERMKITPIGGWSLGTSPQYYEFSHNRAGGSKERVQSAYIS